jgi:hypothetical protein
MEHSEYAKEEELLQQTLSRIKRKREQVEKEEKATLRSLRSLHVRKARQFGGILDRKTNEEVSGIVSFDFPFDSFTQVSDRSPLTNFMIDQISNIIKRLNESKFQVPGYILHLNRKRQQITKISLQYVPNAQDVKEWEEIRNQATNLRLDSYYIEKKIRCISLKEAEMESIKEGNPLVVDLLFTYDYPSFTFKVRNTTLTRYHDLSGCLKIGGKRYEAFETNQKWLETQGKWEMGDPRGFIDYRRNVLIPRPCVESWTKLVCGFFCDGIKTIK